MDGIYTNLQSSVGVGLTRSHSIPCNHIVTAPQTLPVLVASNDVLLNRLMPYNAPPERPPMQDRPLNVSTPLTSARDSTPRPALHCACPPDSESTAEYNQDTHPFPLHIYQSRSALNSITRPNHKGAHDALCARSLGCPDGVAFRMRCDVFGAAFLLQICGEELECG
jgi:hypothetical protein